MPRKTSPMTVAAIFGCSGKRSKTIQRQNIQETPHFLYSSHFTVDVMFLVETCSTFCLRCACVHPHVRSIHLFRATQVMCYAVVPWTELLGSVAPVTAEIRSGQCDLGGREAKVASRFAWFADGPSVPWAGWEICAEAFLGYLGTKKEFYLLHFISHWTSQ